MGGSFASASAEEGKGAPWILLGVGLVLLYPMTLKPLLLLSEVRDWQAVPCTVVESGIDSGGDQDSVFLRFRYTYQFGGRTYEGTRYDLGSPRVSRWRAGAEKTVRENPVGTRRRCRVNPNHPAEAIAEPGTVDASACISIPAPPVLLLIGSWMLFKRSRGRSGASTR